jgi:hypothetical protein
MVCQSGLIPAATCTLSSVAHATSEEHSLLNRAKISGPVLASPWQHFMLQIRVNGCLQPMQKIALDAIKADSIGWFSDLQGFLHALNA